MLYTLSQDNVTLVPGQDLVTIIAGAGKALFLVEIKIDGMDAVSAVNEIVFDRSTGGTTGGGALTPRAKVATAPAATFTNFTSWSAQPTIAAGSHLAAFGLNSYGGKDRYGPFIPTERPYILGLATAEQWSFRCISGTGKVSWHIVVDE